MIKYIKYIMSLLIAAAMLLAGYGTKAVSAGASCNLKANPGSAAYVACFPPTPDPVVEEGVTFGQLQQDGPLTVNLDAGTITTADGTVLENINLPGNENIPNGLIESGKIMVLGGDVEEEVANPVNDHGIGHYTLGICKLDHETWKVMNRDAASSVGSNSEKLTKWISMMNKKGIRVQREPIGGCEALN